MKSTYITAQIEGNAAVSSEHSLRYSWWSYPNLLSLDAPIVAVLWFFAFSRTFGSPFAWPAATVLFLTVWAIYIADRLLDGLRQKDWDRATTRHRFVHVHQKVFLVLLGLIVLIAAIISLKELPLDLLLAGLGLCGVVALYFTAFVRLVPQFKPLRAKEFACGFVFAIGTALGVDVLRHGLLSHPLEVLPSILLFAGLCIFNCLVIAARERHSDQINDPTAASGWWLQLDRDLMFLGLGLCIVSVAFCFFGGHFFIYLVIFISSLFLTLLHFFQERFAPSLSRVLADAVLLSPLLLLL